VLDLKLSQFAPEADQGGVEGWSPNVTRCKRHGARTNGGRPCPSPATKKGRCRLHGGASGSGGPSGKRNGQYRHSERTKVAMRSSRNSAHSRSSVWKSVLYRTAGPYIWHDSEVAERTDYVCSLGTSGLNMRSLQASPVLTPHSDIQAWKWVQCRDRERTSPDCVSLI
jgi:hypothetical protein